MIKFPCLISVQFTIFAKLYWISVIVYFPMIIVILVCILMNLSLWQNCCIFAVIFPFLCVIAIIHYLAKHYSKTSDHSLMNWHNQSFVARQCSPVAGSSSDSAERLGCVGWWTTMHSVTSCGAAPLVARHQLLHSAQWRRGGLLQPLHLAACTCTVAQSSVVWRAVCYKPRDTSTVHCGYGKWN